MKHTFWLALVVALSTAQLPAIHPAMAKDAVVAVAAKGTLVDLNTATADVLNGLPGVSAKKAKAIINGRPYTSVDDLLKKSVVSKSAFGKFKDLVKVSADAKAAAPAAAGAALADTSADALPPEPNTPIDLNSASIEELNALPGISAAKAKAISAGRPYTSMSDFAGKDIVPKAALAKLKGAIEVLPVSKSVVSAASSSSTTGLSPNQAAARVRIKQCSAQWQAAKAAGQLPAGQKWPQFWSDCNKRLKANG